MSSASESETQDLPRWINSGPKFTAAAVVILAALATAVGAAPFTTLFGLAGEGIGSEIYGRKTGKKATLKRSILFGTIGLAFGAAADYSCGGFGMAFRPKPINLGIPINSQTTKVRCVSNKSGDSLTFKDEKGRLLRFECI